MNTVHNRFINKHDIKIRERYIDKTCCIEVNHAHTKFVRFVCMSRCNIEVNVLETSSIIEMYIEMLI